MNSSNSSLPPSSDTPWNKPKLRPSIPSGKKRGGQKGHKGHHRELVPTDTIARFEHDEASVSPITRRRARCDAGSYQR
jgi:transposase